MSQTPAGIDELIEATRDGTRFYGEAIARIGDPHLKSVFRAIVDGKNRLIAAVAAQVQLRGATPFGAQALRAALRRCYAEVLAQRGASARGIARLDAAEERLLAAFESAAATSEAPLRRAIVRHLPRLRLCQAELRNLRTRLAA